MNAQEAYDILEQHLDDMSEVQCPHCKQWFDVEIEDIAEPLEWNDLD